MEACSETIMCLLERQQREVDDQLMQQRVAIKKLMAEYAASVTKQLQHNFRGASKASPHFQDCHAGFRDLSKGSLHLEERSYAPQDRSYAALVPHPGRSHAADREDATSACSSDSDSLGVICGACKGLARRGLFSPALYQRLVTPIAQQPLQNGLVKLEYLDRQLSGDNLGATSWLESVVQRMVEDNDDREEIEVHNKIQEWLLPIVHSCWFQFIIGFVVFVNVVLLGVEVDNKLTSLMAGETAPSVFMNTVVNVQHIIFNIFVVEIGLRVLAEQLDFFKGPHWKWNIFEAAIVAGNALDFYKILSHGMPGMSSLRALRVIRIFRAVRIIRMFRFLQRMRLMVFSMLACFGSFVWALVLLLIVIFVFAIYLQDAALYYFQTHPKNFNPSVEAKVNKYWCGMWMSVESLIYSIAGGADWSDLAEPFMAMNKLHGILYIGFIMFTTFMVLNVLVGIFVQESADLAYWDRELVLETAVSKQEATRNILGELFEEIGGADGRICLAELEAALRVDRIRAYFAHLNIDMKENARVFFELLDGDNNGFIERDEFVFGCARLQGGAKPLELANLVADCRLMSRTMTRMDARLRDLAAQTLDILAALHSDASNGSLNPTGSLSSPQASPDRVFARHDSVPVQGTQHVQSSH